MRKLNKKLGLRPIPTKPMSECAICYETKEDFIHCPQCVHEVCLQCYHKLTNEKCPFCNHLYHPEETLDPATFVLTRAMARVIHPDWDDNYMEAQLAVVMRNAWGLMRRGLGTDMELARCMLAHESTPTLARIARCEGVRVGRIPIRFRLLTLITRKVAERTLPTL